MGDVGQIAEAVGWIAKVTYEALHKSQRELIDEAYEKATRDVVRFKQASLDVDFGTIQLLLDGLMFGIRIDLTADQVEILRSRKAGLDGYDLLGLYARARGAEFAQRVCEIVQTSPKD